MTDGFHIDTERLILREWRDEDGPEFVRVTNTPAVMEHLGGLMTPERKVAIAPAQQGLQRDHGYCFWLLERREDGALLGFCGLEPGTIGPIAGGIEIGWRLREDAWGKGYAREAAAASLDWGWAHLSADRIMAITTPGNVRSWGLMERLGMIRRRDMDFDHPDLPEDDLLRPHITYTIDRPAGSNGH